jgi:RNA-directed DNA polymerase
MEGGGAAARAPHDRLQTGPSPSVGPGPRRHARRGALGVPPAGLALEAPAPGRTVELPTPGGGTRRLGRPRVLDRCRAPALLPGRGPLFAPDFSARRDGVRPGRSAPQARQHMGHAIEEGARGGVPLDLAHCFDRGHHARVRGRVARTGQDRWLLKRRRRDLNAGLRPDGAGRQREAGRSPGRPRSPRLSTVRWEDVDQELERRGARFCRDADDAHGYVRSRRAGERGRASDRGDEPSCPRLTAVHPFEGRAQWRRRR